MTLSGNLGTMRAFFGTTPAQHYSPSGWNGDTQTQVIPFPTPFDTDFVSVIACASDRHVLVPDNRPAVVAMAWDANKNGFTLRARNSDSSPGAVACEWLAVDFGGASIAAGPPLGLTCAKLLPQPFALSGDPGDWQQWTIPNLTQVENSMLRLFSASASPNNCLPVVPVGSAFSARARNSDTNRRGSASLSYLSIGDVGPPQKYLAQAGRTNPVGYFEASGSDGWSAWQVYFALPFMAPPLVFLTANNVGAAANNVAAPVGAAVYIDATGFILRAQNSDIVPGVAGFNWIAIGCARCY